MDQESTPTTTPKGQAPADEGTGREPDTESTPKAEAKTFDEAYVKQLRKEAAAARTELGKVNDELGKLRDRDKSESERLTERVAESERRASEAEARLIRYEVIAARKLPLDAAVHLAGESREQIEASADWLAAQLAEQTQQSKPPGFDGGARTTPEQTKPPDKAHNDLLLRAMGRAPS